MQWRDAIHRGQDPYAGFPVERYPEDLEGWGWDSPIFEHVIATYRPQSVVEIGSWKGRSAIRLAELLKQYDIAGAEVLCVDTFCCSLEMWKYRNNPDIGLIRLEHGRPNLYPVFLANIIRSGHQDIITPFTVDSLTAARLLRHEGLFADAIYLDASHEGEDVAMDLRHWWPVLKPGGVLFGDDYYPEGNWQLPLVNAVDAFVEELGMPLFYTGFTNKFLIVKP